MKEVPNVISNNDLILIKKIMDLNIIMNKKIYFYLNNINNEDLNKLLTKTKKMHSNHYREILNILE